MPDAAGLALEFEDTADRLALAVIEPLAAGIKPRCGE